MSETTSGNGFVRIFKDKGSRKLLIFAAVVIVAALAYAFHGGGPKQKEQASRLPSAAEAGGNVTGDRITAEYQRIRDQATAQEVRNARQTGATVTAPIRPVENRSSAMPTSLDGIGEQAPPRPHPPITPPPVQAATPPAQAPVYTAPRPANDQQAQLAAQQQIQLVQAMQQQMSKILPAPPVPAQVIYFQAAQADASTRVAGGLNNRLGASSLLTPSTAQGGAGGTGPAAGGGLSGTPGSANPVQLASAQTGRQRFQAPAPGTIVYSRLVGRVNSDTPGPVIGEVLQGAFSGARLLGSFQSTPQGALISFNTMTVSYTDENGEQKTEVVPIKGVAVDTSHLGTAMATDINNHLLLNIGMAFGTSFLQGIGQAVAQSGSYAAMGPYGTTVANPVLTMPGELMMGVGAGAAQAGQIFQNLYGNKPPTITVEADTPFGLLFLGN